MMRLAALALPGMLVLAAAASAAPLIVYAGSLALFGLPHVLAELRYVDLRFAPRWGGQRGLALLVILGALVVVRILGLGDAFGPGVQPGIELLLLTASLALVLPPLVRAGCRRAALLVVGFAALLIGGLAAPLATLVALAFLHNLTPLAFLAEALRGSERRRALGLGFLGFGLVPALIAGGLFAALEDGSATIALLDTGTLDSQLGVFVPEPLGRGDLARRLFAAAAYLQCLHYAVVLHVLPRLVDDGRSSTTSVVPWPGTRRMLLLLIGLGAVFTLGFLTDFRATRGIYGVFAAVHAWVEFPVLAAALGAAATARPGRVRTA